jgi:hypothetical protein
MTLFDDEVAAIVALRRKGRTFSYIAEEIGVCRDAIGRELRAQGIATGHIKADRRARRGAGFLAVLRLTIHPARRLMTPRPAAGILGMRAGEASRQKVFASIQYFLIAGFDTPANSQCLVRCGRAVSWM